MKKLNIVLLLILGLSFLSIGQLSFAQVETTLFSFEDGAQGWEIPDWAFEKEDMVAEKLALSSEYAKDGKSSLELAVDFPGGSWTAAYVEIVEFFDWTPYSNLAVDVYLPTYAPAGLKGKFILTVGEDWKWIEMSRAVKLIPGQWTTISANLLPGSTDWRRTQVTDAFRQDVRKLGVRIESNLRPVYRGSIYIDNVRLIK